MKGRTEPAPGLLRRVDAVAQAAFPVASTAALLVLAAVPVGPPGMVWAAALPGVFFWSVFRPATLPPPAVFGIGLLQDLLTLAPVGSGVLTLLVVHGLVVRWRPFLARQSFLMVWLAFCGLAAGAAGLAWAVQALFGWRLPPLPPGLHALALSAGLYPLLAWLLGLAHGAMRNAEDAA